MKGLFLAFVFFIFSTNAYAIEVASCSNPKGKSYFPYLGLVEKKDAGWSNNEIKNGIVKLRKDENGDFDVVFVDAAKRIISSREDGGQVIFLNKGENEISFLVHYPGKAVEVYTFLKNKDGKNEYIYLLSRGGDAVMITNSGLMRGDCDFIDFSIAEANE